MIKTALMASVVLGTITNANAQGVSSCLADAASEYKRAYASHCPGGLNYPCVLRPLAASQAKSDWASARSRCFEDHSAAALDRADEIQRSRDEPRGKFRISPQ